MLISTSEKNTLWKAARQSIYFCLLWLYIFFIHSLAYQYNADAFHEFGMVENLQLATLFISGLSFAIQAIGNKSYRQILLLLASLCFLACCRELDSFFDHHLPFISWRLGFIFPLLACVYAYINFRQTLSQLLNFLQTPTFYMMCSAVP